VVVDVAAGAIIGGGGVYVLRSVVVVVLLTGCGPQPAKATDPAINAIPMVIRSASICLTPTRSEWRSS
jgi:hypothetical protein